MPPIRLRPNPSDDDWPLPGSRLAQEHEDTDGLVDDVSPPPVEGDPAKISSELRNIACRFIAVPGKRPSVSGRPFSSDSDTVAQQITR